MNTQTIVEIIGYVGSALVLISFMMSSVVKLRVVNTVGSLIFTVYALIIHSYPTAVMNACLVCVNIYYLWKLRHTHPSYRMLSMNPEETFVQDFLHQWEEDIKTFFPNRHPDSEEVNRVYMVFHDSTVAGIMMGHEKDGVLEVDLDYSTPAYRDCSVGKYLMDHLSKPILLRYVDAEPAHISYLKQLGFTENGNSWEKQLSQ